MSRTTTALVVPELNGKFVLKEVYLDEMQPDELLVEIYASGICHTDLSCAAGTLPCRPNAVLGHEGAGIVLQTGSAADPSIQPGDKVLLSFSHCEACPACTSGHPSYCHTFNHRNFGGSRPPPPPESVSAPSHHRSSSAMLASATDPAPVHSSFFGQSSFARHALVHRSTAVRVPADTPLDLFAPMGCGMQTGAGVVINSLRVRPGSSIAVFGVGSVGMAAVMAAKFCGAAIIVVVDLHEGRLELARKLGATHAVVVGSDGDVVEQIKRLSGSNGVDYAVDCTGVQAVVRTMIDSLGTLGRGATVGAPGPGKTVAVDIMNHLTYGKEYVGCCEGDSLPKEFIPFLIEKHAKGEFPMEQFVTFYDVADYEQAMEDSKTGKAIKAVLRWSSI